MCALSLKKILVTGGAGFLGCHLCERLLESPNVHVFCLDNFYTGSKSNIESLFSHSRFTFIEHDICTPFTLDVDEIYNLACPASPFHYQKDPIKTMHCCTIGFLHVLELAKAKGAKILQASTSEVYGNPLVHPQREDYFGNVNPIGKRSCYDEGKRCAETLLFDYHRMYGLEVKNARIFNTYGPRMQKDDGRVVSNFITQALNKNNLTVYGTGKQTRSFCYVDDLIEGLILLMASPKECTGPMNLGNPTECTIEELSQMILRLCGHRGNLVALPLPMDDPKKRCPDISLAIRTLGWQPRVSLEEGLKKTIAFFKSEGLPEQTLSHQVS